MNIKVIVSLWLLICTPLFVGCNSSETAQSISELYGGKHPSIWMISDGKMVDIGGEIVSIVGTDDCNTGFGDTYPCWYFSTIPGEAQLVTLSNGIREKWTTTATDEGRLYFVRPNGLTVSAI